MNTLEKYQGFLFANGMHKDTILSKFKKDGEGNLYNERWISEIMDAESYVTGNKVKTLKAGETRQKKRAIYNDTPLS